MTDKSYIFMRGESGLLEPVDEEYLDQFANPYELSIEDLYEIAREEGYPSIKAYVQDLFQHISPVGIIHELYQHYNMVIQDPKVYNLLSRHASGNLSPFDLYLQWVYGQLEHKLEGLKKEFQTGSSFRNLRPLIEQDPDADLLVRDMQPMRPEDYEFYEMLLRRCGEAIQSYLRGEIQYNDQTTWEEIDGC